MKKNICIALLSGLFIFSTISAQTLDEARELYKIGEFQRALPVFEKELVAKPTDASLNQWYGVCLYETGGDLAKAEACITEAAKKGIQEAYLYLGRIYTKTYRFDLAEKEFERYAKLKRRDKEAIAKIEEDKAWMASFKKIASRPEDIQIIDSVVVDKNVFLSAYKLSPSTGKIDYAKSFFANSSNKENTVYQNEKKDKIYYSKMVEKEKPYALFSMEKLMGDYGNEKPLSADNFGVDGDLGFPFVMADGVTLYFAAQNAESTEGYDLYVTRYNMNNDSYLTPEKLNAPFNSPFNDYMYVVDEEKGIGWFASDRFQPQGKVCVYTFIPNSSVEMVESEDESYVYNRAKIHAIKDSWKQNVDYRKEILLARKDIIEVEQVRKDFDFVVNDDYTYYTLNDFKSSAAKTLYQQVVEKKKTLETISQKLADLRDSYNESASNSKAQEILKLENQQPLLQREIEDLELKSRSHEIAGLSNR